MSSRISQFNSHQGVQSNTTKYQRQPSSKDDGAVHSNRIDISRASSIHDNSQLSEARTRQKRIITPRKYISRDDDCSHSTQDKSLISPDTTRSEDRMRRTE